MKRLNPYTVYGLGFAAVLIGLALSLTTNIALSLIGGFLIGLGYFVGHLSGRYEVEREIESTVIAIEAAFDAIDYETR